MLNNRERTTSQARGLPQVRRLRTMRKQNPPTEQMPEVRLGKRPVRASRAQKPIFNSTLLPGTDTIHKPKEITLNHKPSMEKTTPFSCTRREESTTAGEGPRMGNTTSFHCAKKLNSSGRRLCKNTTKYAHLCGPCKHKYRKRNQPCPEECHNSTSTKCHYPRSTAGVSSEQLPHLEAGDDSSDQQPTQPTTDHNTTEIAIKRETETPTNNHKSHQIP